MRGKRSIFLSMVALTLGIGLFVNPGKALAHHNFNDWGGDKPNASVPEPSTLLLLGSGMAGLALYGRKWRRK